MNQPPNHTFCFPDRSIVKHGQSRLVTLPVLALQYLELDERCCVDMILDLDARTITIAKAMEGNHGGTHTVVGRRGAATAGGDPQGQRVSAQAADRELMKEPDPEAVLEAIDTNAFAATDTTQPDAQPEYAQSDSWGPTPTAEGEALQTQEAEYGTTTEGDADGAHQGTDWERDPYQNQDGRD